MYNILKIQQRALRLMIAAVMACGLFSSCDSVIYDYEGDCDVKVLAKFRYDLNMKWADAFPSEVTSVHLYAFDKNDRLVWHGTENGEALREDDYAMTLDLPAGDYHLLAWCGLDTPESATRHFTVPDVTVGTTTSEELICRMERARDAAGAYSDRRLLPLFHGVRDISIPVTDDGGTYCFTVPLTKNTNHVRVILQHLNGNPVDAKQFTFTIEEENGLMAHDNTLLSDEKITYRPYHTGSGTASLGIDDYPQPGEKAAGPRATIESISVAIADLSIARLVEGRKTYLTIRTADADNRLVARIPLTDYALLLKDGYEREMTDQEYLDREDEYNLTFFLDEDDYWMSTSIIINSWKLVFNNMDFNSKQE
jgi:hypothetical protein